MKILKNGTIIDGSGKTRTKADILLEGQKITDIGNFPSVDAEEIDCTNLCIIPGIVDIHSHSDLESLQHRSEKIKQGVTSEVVGNCGFSLFPSKPNLKNMLPAFEIFDTDPTQKWDDADAYFSDLDSKKSYTNIASLTGQGTLRAFVKGAKSGAMDPQETINACKILAKCLEQGSVGISTGLNEVPSAYADLEELITLAEIVHEKGGLYTSHLRDYKFRFLEAVEEALEIGRRTGIPVQLSHLQAVGQKNWHKIDLVLELIEKAELEGVDVEMDAYPYLAGSCKLTQSLPGWSLEGGTAELIRRLNNPQIRKRIAEDTEEDRSNTWKDVVVSNVSMEREMIGKNIQEIADICGQDGIQTALDLLLKNNGSVHVVSFNQSEDNLKKVLTHPLTSIITDGLHHEGIPHPRTFGTYPTFFGEYVREKKWMTLEEAVRKTTALPAQRFKLEKRGMIKVGYWADILIFSPEEIGTESNYMKPDVPPVGINHVIVNGEWELFEGSLTGKQTGIALKYS